MTRRSSSFAALAASIAGAVVALVAGDAHATVVQSCGNLDFSGSETCTLETSGGCTAQCTPVNVDVQCSAQLEASCSGGCNVNIDASCTTSCEASCTGGCSAGNFSCEGSCSADCEGSCSASCASAGDQTKCKASCQETCGANCQASCSGQPPSCSPVTCQAACQGSCQAQADMSCQIQCQANGYAQCETQLTGGCTAQCSQPQGALFCDGNWVDASDLNQCEQDLQSLLNIQVSGSASCNGDTCQAQATASCGQIAPGQVPPLPTLLAGVGLAVAAGGVVRRRIKKSRAS